MFERRLSFRKGSGPSATLRKVDTHVISTEDCAKFVGTRFTNSILCTSGEDNQASCSVSLFPYYIKYFLVNLFQEPVRGLQQAAR